MVEASPSVTIGSLSMEDMEKLDFAVVQKCFEHVVQILMAKVTENWSLVKDINEGVDGRGTSTASTG